jgi:hypothetical protein
MSQDPKARVMLSHFPYPSSWIFIPLFTHLSMNQACIRLLRISRTHPHRRSFSNLGDSAATSIATPFHQILIKMEEGPNKRNEVAILADHVLVLILRRFTPAPYATTSVSIAPGTASSQNPSVVRSCPRLSPDSCMTPRKANATSPASP